MFTQPYYVDEYADTKRLAQINTRIFRLHKKLMELFYSRMPYSRQREQARAQWYKDYYTLEEFMTNSIIHNIVEKEQVDKLREGNKFKKMFIFVRGPRAYYEA